MTEETTATTEASVTATTPVAATPAAHGCCSDSHGTAHAMPLASVLPMANDCCSSGPECSTESQPAAEEGSPVDDGALIDALREVIDPELMINIVDLGLVYSINHTDRKVNVEMTLTSPACPAGPQIIMQSKLALEKLNGIDVAEIKLTMSPPWTPARMTDEARDQLGIF
ncbi:MAG TPA: metal-sulfur cluster assembly factor [Schlesneria sp.]